MRIKVLTEGPLQADDPELVDYLRKNYLHLPNNLPYNLKEQKPVDLVYTQYKTANPSWIFINSILEDLFPGQLQIQPQIFSPTQSQSLMRFFPSQPQSPLQYFPSQPPSQQRGFFPSHPVTRPGFFPSEAQSEEGSFPSNPQSPEGVFPSPPQTARGFFIEAGALDGEYLSNTLQLELKQKWTGLLIEADQQSYNVLREKNRKTWTSPACLATQIYPHNVILSSFGRQGKNSNWLDRGAARIEKDPVWKGEGPGYKTFQHIQCFPTLTFLLALNVTKVNLFSLDVEGVEMDVLRAFPFDKITVDVWVIEHIKPNENQTIVSRSSQVTEESWKYEDAELVAFMEARNYYFFDMFCHPIPDYVFVNRDSEIFKRLGVPNHLRIRRGLCFHKANWEKDETEFILALHRDKRHYPRLRYKGR
ncbi:hypothetical protein SK128_002640 [Halocaridina rubra]|uniref:Methyltransferase FkbM domain-containing protein n=1 Tax=Halocaridina rubra TaxID=373956 RepID=A0AAN8X5Y0_HALRR